MDASVPPASYSLPEDIRATFVRVFAYMGGLAILAIAAAVCLRTPAVVAAIGSSPQPQWTKVDRPHPAFELAMPELAASPYDYSILRRDADGARKDVLSWGNAAASGPYVMVEVYRPGSQSERFIDAASEIAARILDFTVTDDVKPAGRIESKFGAVPLVDFAIAANGRERRCLGFARPFDRPSMQIAGWYCRPAAEVVDRAALSCLLDRLTILSAGGDSRLDELFARAEVNRTFCGQRNPILAATPERAAPIPSPYDSKTHNAKLRVRLRLQ
jgi:hypothetical protein